MSMRTVLPSAAVRCGHLATAKLLGAAALLVAAAAGRAPGASDAVAFRLGEGHAVRDELCFIVAAPGTIRVIVDSDTPGVRLFVTLQPPSRTAVVAREGEGRIELVHPSSDAERALGREWAVGVMASDRRSPASGRIRVDYPDGRPPAGHELDRWLLDRPALAWHLQWRDPDQGNPRGFSAWPADAQRRLRQFFDDARAGRAAALADPPPNLARPADGEFPRTVLSRDDALDLYLASAAHSLALEHDRRLPWSLAELNGAELDAILDSLTFFHVTDRPNGYEIVPGDHGWAVPAPPAVAWRFLEHERLLRPTRHETLVAVVGWCRGLSHFGGGMTTANFADHWGYRGLMPVSRALEGTRYAGVEFKDAFSEASRCYTAGCHGTVGLLVSVLRAANIPARFRLALGDGASHATALFLSEDRALTHGDDPYNRLAVRAPDEELMIDLPTYQRWLGPLADSRHHIGIQAMVLGLKYLSPSLLELRRKDLDEGRPKASSAVRACFGEAFTLEELERARLWERLDAELAGAPADHSTPAPRTAKSDAAPNPAPNRHGPLAIEGEDMKSEPSGGRVDAQPMEAFTASRWSGNRQLWWTGAGEKDTLDLRFDVPADGVYRLSAIFTKAPDYGIFAITVDGAASGPAELDLFDREVTRTPSVPLGEFKLRAGGHRLGVEVRGRNPASQPGLMFGLDALMLERIE